MLVIFAGPGREHPLRVRPLHRALHDLRAASRRRRSTAFAPGSAAAALGLQSGDRIVSIDGAPMTRRARSPDTISAVGREAADGRRPPRRHRVVARAARGRRRTAGVYRLGFILRGAGLSAAGGGAGVGARHRARCRRDIVTSLGHLVTGEGRKDISSPVGIVQGSSDAAKQGTDSFLWVLGLISLSIALLNLLPLLPLDGGHIVFAIVEGIRGRAVDARGLRARLDRRHRARAAPLRDRAHERHRPAFLRRRDEAASRLRRRLPLASRRRSRMRPEASSAASSSRWYSAREISTAPSETRCGVAHWTSSRRSPPASWSSSHEPEERRLRRAACVGGTSTRPRRGRRSRRRTARRRAPRRPTPRPSAPSRARAGGCTRRRTSRVDPAVRPPRVGAAADHVGERGVDADLVAAGGARSERDGPKPADRDHGPLQPETTRRGRPRPASGRDPPGRRRGACRARGRRRRAQTSCGWSSAGARASRWWAGARKACLYT